MVRIFMEYSLFLSPFGVSKLTLIAAIYLLFLLLI